MTSARSLLPSGAGPHPRSDRPRARESGGPEGPPPEAKKRGAFRPFIIYNAGTAAKCAAVFSFFSGGRDWSEKPVDRRARAVP